ncbi:uncharacterized protein LOC131628258 [Vicia villosa]|uniref:uncharacterized protein LOC131628258 n=1 Tax=Vicia villosa TaxID=3911 RepID=UPI00273B0EAF|nr:uncharacterized protein LOC131628258 [Vicia villosa]
MMPRPLLLVFLLLMIVITSQFEWKQQLVVDVDSTSSLSLKQRRISKGVETVKEKIILVQEKNIRRLNEVVRHLQQQLHQCRSTNNGTTNSTIVSLY